MQHLYILLACVLYGAYTMYQVILRNRVSRDSENRQFHQTRLEKWNAWHKWVLLVFIALVGYQLWDDMTYFQRVQREKLREILGFYAGDPWSKRKLQSWVQQNVGSPIQQTQQLVAVNKLDNYLRQTGRQGASLQDWETIKRYGEPNKRELLALRDEYDDIRMERSQNLWNLPITINLPRNEMWYRSIDETRRKQKSQLNPEMIGLVLYNMKKQGLKAPASKVREYLYGPREWGYWSPELYHDLPSRERTPDVRMISRE